MSCDNLHCIHWHIVGSELVQCKWEQQHEVKQNLDIAVDLQQLLNH